MRHWDLRALAVQPHHPEVLTSDDEGRTIVIQIPAGERLQEHQVHERAWVVVIDGEVEISQDDDSLTGRPGTLAIFDPSEPHEVRATQDALLLLLLAPWPGEGHPSRRH